MRYLLVLPFFLLFSCGGSGNKSKDYSLSVNTEESSDVITCWGIGDIELDDDLTSLEEKVGSENISADSFTSEGGGSELVSFLWKGSPKEIIVHWKEGKPQSGIIDYLEVKNPESIYHFSNGIHAGSKLEDIVRLNGDKDISLFGFEGDKECVFSDFAKGKLAGDIPCFGGIFTVSPEAVEEAKDIMGNQKVSSSNAAFKKYPATLTSVWVKN